MSPQPVGRVKFLSQCSINRVARPPNQGLDDDTFSFVTAGNTMRTLDRQRSTFTWGTQGVGFVVGLLIAGLVGPCLLASDARAQDPARPAAPNAAPGAVGAGAWTQTINKDGSIVLDEKLTETVKKVSGYFRDLKNLRGAFVQTNPDAKRMRGKFYIKQPGRFRFDYGSGSKQVIVSDGEYLAIQDLDLKTDDVIALEQTPFRILLKKDVDLLRDAKIIDVQEAEDLIVLSLSDRAPESSGRIKLFLSKKPVLELKEWVTTDAQGLDTRIEISDLNKTDDIDVALFKRTPVGLQRIQ
jgi:outer membrane lipoprotein-sorting protein